MSDSDFSDDDFAQPDDNNILQQARDTLPEITITEWHPPTEAASTVSKDTERQDSAVGDDTAAAAEVLRQMEYYFSDANLPHDSHLLGLLQEGDGTVSFNEVCSFAAMRKLARSSKQKTWVKQVVRQSELIEIIGNSKHPRIRRKIPLIIAPTVTPKVKRRTPTTVVPADKPWLTKGMMKPTGFEEGAEEVTAEDEEQDAADYPSDEAFTQRIETAVTRYCGRRKMHQDVRKIFDKFISFGGFQGGQAQFIGGGDVLEQDGSSKKKVSNKQHYNIWKPVLDGLEPGEDGSGPTWRVDFVACVKGFLSDAFIAHFAWYDQEQVKTATNVLRNFHRYLLLHKVCPEYGDQINAAIEVCDVAEKELPQLAMVDKHLPGGFNVACSMLFKGHHSSQMAQGDWAQGTEGGSWNKEQAWTVFQTGVFVHGKKEQIDAVAQSKGDAGWFGPTTEFQVGLEIISVEMPSETARSMYGAAQKKDEIIKPMGKLHCKEWKVPHAPAVDFPPGVRDPRSQPDPDVRYEFLLEASTLEFCYPGCTFEATVKQIEQHPGIMWIDYFEAAYASFFTYLPNELIRKWVEPGPPKEWMVRQNEKRGNEQIGRGMELERIAEDDEELDW